MKKLIMVVFTTLLIATSAMAQMQQVDENDFAKFMIDNATISFTQTQYGRIAHINTAIFMAPGSATKMFGKKYKNVTIVENEYAINCDKKEFLPKWTKLYDKKGKFVAQQGPGQIEDIQQGTFISSAYNYVCVDEGANAKADQ